MLSFGKDLGRDEAFARLTRLIKNTLSVDIAAVSTIDNGLQNFKSIDGIDVAQVPLERSFCRIPFREGSTTVISDTAENDEFADDELVLKAGLRAYVGVPLKTSSGTVFGTVCGIHKSPRLFSDKELFVLEDIAKIAASELELREYANTDMLTTALTRRAFMRDSARLKDMISRKGLHLSVLMIDIDHFKLINDNYGHSFGDEVLRSVALALKVNLREYDLLGRLGGEEFAVTLEGDSVTACAIAERLKQAISSLQFNFSEKQVNVTASFGVAELIASEEIEESLKRADVALYAAKSSGRNRVIEASKQFTTVCDASRMSA